MKMRKTPNAERPTLNIEFRKLSVNETADGDYGTRPKYDLEERLLEFTANVVRLADSLPNTKAGNHIAGQLLRSGTSPLANHGEVEAAESRKDFLHKLRICLKELRETWRWLGLIGRLDLSKASELRAALTEVEELIRSSQPALAQRRRRKMKNRPSEFDIGRWALGVRRFLA